MHTKRSKQHLSTIPSRSLFLPSWTLLGSHQIFYSHPQSRSSISQKCISLFSHFLQKEATQRWSTSGSTNIFIQLTDALHFYPKYFDALILRAKILSKLHRYYDSLEDLNKTLKIEPGNSQSLLAKADCLRALSQYTEATKIYT